MFVVIFKFVATSLVIILAIALILTATNRPPTLASDGGLDFTNTLNTQVNPLPISYQPLPDGWQMPYRRVDGPADTPLLILLHGSGWYGAQFNTLAPQLANHATVLVPDLRGHAPTTRQNSGGWAHVLTARLIGLSMLNAFKIKALNHLTVIQFAMPKQVLDGPLGANATSAYSYRLNTSYAPRNAYENDVAGLPDFLLLAGTKDEAFIADAYQPLMSGLTDKGQYHLIDGAAHLDVVNAPQTLDLMGKLLDQRR